ncbi:MAG: hypothetical protein DRP01_00260 [Archaeoglobales archaeon]|nr:MAG: hypothetical protein DRP01_00260 [Archaeoglobales archaeon]
MSLHWKTNGDISFNDANFAGGYTQLGDAFAMSNGTSGGSFGRLDTALGAQSFFDNAYYDIGDILSELVNEVDTIASASGEANTASNAGTGVSLYYQKAGVDLEFNGIKSENNMLSCTLDAGTHDIELTVNVGNIDHGSLNATSLTHDDHTIYSLADGSRDYSAAVEYDADYSGTYTDRSLVDKGYVDAVAAGLHPKAAVRVATTADLAAYTKTGTGVGAYLEADANGSINTPGIDGITDLAAGDRILFKNAAAGAETADADNGLYEVTVVGTAGTPWRITRTTDFDGSPASEVQGGDFMFVQEGTANADSGWVLVTDGTITVDTTALQFTQFSGAGQISAGTGLTKDGNTIHIGDGSTGDIGGINRTASDISVAVDGSTMQVTGNQIAIDTWTLDDAYTSGSDANVGVDSYSVDWQLAGTSYAFQITSTNDTVSFTGDGGGDIDAVMNVQSLDVDTTGVISLDTVYDDASAVSITTNGGTKERVTVTNTQGDNNLAIGLIAPAGGITLDANKVYLTSDTDTTWELSADEATSHTMVITSTNVGAGTAVLDVNVDDAITIDSTNAGISLDAAGASNFTTSSGNLALSASSILDLDGGSDVTINAGGSVYAVATSGVQLTGPAGINLATTNQELDISTGTGAVDINSGAFTVDAGGASHINTASANLTLSTTTAGNLVLNSAAGITFTDGNWDGTTDPIPFTDGSSTNFSAFSTPPLSLVHAINLAYAAGGAANSLQEVYTADDNTVTMTAAIGTVAWTGAANQNSEIMTFSQLDTTNDPDVILITNAGTGASIELAGAGTRSINSASANLALTTTTSGAITADSAGAISLDAAAASNFTTSAGALTLDGAGGISLVGNAAEIDLTTTGAIDLNSAAGSWTATAGLAFAATDDIDFDADVYNFGTTAAGVWEDSVTVSAGNVDSQLAQASMTHAGVQTSGAAFTRLTAGTSELIMGAQHKTMAGRVVVIGMKEGDTEVIGYIIDFVAEAASIATGAAVIHGYNVTEIANAGTTSAWDAQVVGAADGSNWGRVEIQVKGEADVSWSANMQTSEVVVSS